MLNLHQLMIKQQQWVEILWSTSNFILFTALNCRNTTRQIHMCGDPRVQHNPELCWSGFGHEFTSLNAPIRHWLYTPTQFWGMVWPGKTSENTCIDVFPIISRGLQKRDENDTQSRLDTNDASHDRRLDPPGCRGAVVSRVFKEPNELLQRSVGFS